MKSSEILGALTLVSAAVIFFLVFYGTDEQAQQPQPEPEKEPVQQTQVDIDSPPELSALINSRGSSQDPSAAEDSSNEGSEQNQSDSDDQADAQSADGNQQSQPASDSKDTEDESTDGGESGADKSVKEDDKDKVASASSESSSEGANSNVDNSADGGDEKAEQEDADSDAEESSSGGAVHTVSKGETLCGISREYFGSPSRWKKILTANSDILDKPENLRVGMKLVIPGASNKQTAEKASKKQKESKSTSSSNPAPKAKKASGGPFLLSSVSREKLYRVKKGDTLYGIAKKLYDDPSEWKSLLKANKDRIDGPSDLRVGMKLVVPSEE